MKKTFYIAVVVTALVLATACQEDKKVIDEQVNSMTLKYLDEPPVEANYEWDGNECINRALNCHAGVDVIGVSRIFREIGTNPNPDKLPRVLSDHIYIGYVKDASSGKLNLTAQFNKNNNTLYLIFTEVKTKKVVFVYPFTSK